MRSGITIDWSCTLCTDEQATFQIELESSVEDSPSQDVGNEEQVQISTEGESSLGVPLQDSLNEEHATHSLRIKCAAG